MNPLVEGGPTTDQVNQYRRCARCGYPMRRIWCSIGWSEWFHAKLAWTWQCQRYWEVKE